jgi:hypothetical protein
MSLMLGLQQNQGEELVNNIIQFHVMLHLANERTNKPEISTCLQDATITCHLQETNLTKKKIVII